MIVLHGLNLPVELSDSRTTIHPSKFKTEKELASGIILMRDIVKVVDMVSVPDSLISKSGETE
jgi:hypothetical protein